MKKKIIETIQLLKERENYNEFEITVGFDGFVDNIFKVIKNIGDNDEIIYFSNIEEFGLYIASKKAMSCSIEMKLVTSKIGGNMPILSNALANMGVKVNCIGAMGYPELNKNFQNMHGNCKLLSIENPGSCDALEFLDGKVMLSENDGVNSITWDIIKNNVGLYKIIECFENSQIIGVFNWSEVKHSNEIWQGILDEVVDQITFSKPKSMIFDLSDCSRKSEEDIIKAIYLITQFQQHFDVMLSLNENEANIVYKAITKDYSTQSIDTIGDTLYKIINIHCLVIHPNTYSIIWRDGLKNKLINQYISQPKISTGGGDNFNAGLCLAELYRVDIEKTLLLANTVSGFYVKHGRSPSVKDMVLFLEEWYQNL